MPITRDQADPQAQSVPGQALPHYLIITALMATLYIWSMPGLISLEDAGLFHMVCSYNGIAHPPGYPLFTLLCQPLYWIPFLTPIVAGNLFSVICACATGCVLFRIARLLFDHIIFSYLAVLAYALSAAFWSQAIIIEVYTLNTLLFSVLLLLAIEYCNGGRVRVLYGFSLAFGLALSNHWPLILLSSPGLFLIIAPRARHFLTEPGWPRNLIICMALATSGLLPYLTLVIKGDPFISLYGEINGLDEFIKYLTRAAYGDGTATAGWDDKGQYLLWLAGEVSVQFGWIGLIFTIIGARVFWQRFTPMFNLACWLIILGSTLILVLLLKFDFIYRYQAIFKPYPLLPYMMLALMLAQGIRSSVDLIPVERARIPMAALTGMLVLSVMFIAHEPTNNRSQDKLADDYARVVLRTVDDSAILLVRGDNQTGPLGYLHHIEKAREDLEIISRDNLVFSNRLISPFAPRKAQADELAAMVEDTKQPVYSLTPLPPPLPPSRRSVDYGLFIGYELSINDSQQDEEYRFLEEHEQFFTRLLTAYEGGEVRDPHTRSFIEALLLGFSRQYFGFAFSRSADFVFPAGFSQRLERLKDTFAGKLMMLQYLLNHNPSGADKLDLLQLTEQAERQMPIEIAQHNEALLYQYAGHVFLLPSNVYPPDRETAIIYFQKSIDALPDVGNESVCRLFSLYNRTQQGEQAAALRQRFEPEDDCLAGNKPAGNKSAGN